MDNFSYTYIQFHNYSPLWEYIKIHFLCNFQNNFLYNNHEKKNVYLHACENFMLLI